jgi:7,8-dihydroneopterin aldolase/epimerase/oxygenase
MIDYRAVHISNWTVKAGIGAYDWEKKITQKLYLDLTLIGDFSNAEEQDDLLLALDYKKLKDSLELWIKAKRWNLLEAFAHDFVNKCLENELVFKVELKVFKPRALAPALVGYTLIRSK